MWYTGYKKVTVTYVLEAFTRKCNDSDLKKTSQGNNATNNSANKTPVSRKCASSSNRHILQFLIYLFTCLYNLLNTEKADNAVYNKHLLYQCKIALIVAINNHLVFNIIYFIGDHLSTTAADTAKQFPAVYQNLTFHCFVIAEQQHPEEMHQLLPLEPLFSAILEITDINQWHWIIVYGHLFCFVLFLSKKLNRTRNKNHKFVTWKHQQEAVCVSKVKITMI